MTRNRIFYGWWIVVACFCFQFTFVASPFSVILKNLMNEFGSGRGPVSLMQTIFFISGGISSLFIGRVIQHHSPRKFLLWGSVIGAICLLLSSLANNLWNLYITYLFYGMGLFGLAGPVTVVTLISRWFTKKRGQALGSVFAGMALGILVITPNIGLIAETFGWRATYVFAGLLVLAINIPLALLVIKDSPEKMGLLPDGDKPVKATNTVVMSPNTPAPAANSQPARLATYFRCLPFWLICFSFPLVAIGESGIFSHEVSFITDMGVSTTLAASALGFTGGISGIGRIASGWLADRISPKYVIFILLSLGLAGLFILMRTETMFMVWLFVVVYGLGQGTIGVMLALVIGDVFGTASLSVIFGFANLLFMLGMSLGPPLAGFIFDATGSYMAEFIVIAIFYLVTIIAVYFGYPTKTKRLKSPASIQS